MSRTFTVLTAAVVVAAIADTWTWTGGLTDKICMTVLWPLIGFAALTMISEMVPAHDRKDTT